jgi:hypothetical protein
MAHGRRPGWLAGVAGGAALSVLWLAVACGPPSRPAQGVEAPPAALGPAPLGWTVAGVNRQYYEVGTDRRVFRSAPASATLRSYVPLPGPLTQPVWAALTQTTAAAPYRGARLALTAYLRVVDVDAPQGVFLRLQVEGPSGAACGPNLLAFDNMYGRRITGSHDWRPYTLVADVPQQATAITFGVHLNGGGAVWADDVALFAVGPDVPVTDDLAVLPNARAALCPGAPTPAPAVLTPVVATPPAAPTARADPFGPLNLAFDLAPPPTPTP